MPSNELEIKDLYKLAKKRVPKMFFDYVDTGSWSGSTYRSNQEDLSRIKFRQRVARDMTGRSIASKMISFARPFSPETDSATSKISFCILYSRII